MKLPHETKDATIMAGIILTLVLSLVVNQLAGLG